MSLSTELKHVEPLAITIHKSEYFHDFTALDTNSHKDTSQELVIRNVLVLDGFYLNRTPKVVLLNNSVIDEGIVFSVALRKQLNDACDQMGMYKSESR